MTLEHNRPTTEPPTVAARPGHRADESSGAGAQPSRLALAVFAIASGTAVANVYLAQPLLATLGAEFGIGEQAVGGIVTATQIGYGLGLFLLVPLADLLPKRGLVSAQSLLLAVALLVFATAAHTPVLLGAAATVGFLAVVAQSLVAYAAALTGPGDRGRIVGRVTSGIVIGILLARTISGTIADVAGWRAVYLTSAAVTLLLVFAMRRTLPYVPGRGGPLPRHDIDDDLGVGGERPDSVPRYPALLRSTITLFATDPLLRTRGLLALLIFAAFSTLWSTLALLLSTAPFTLSHTAIGAFGLAGVAGAAAATPAGRLFDRGRGRRVTGFALLLLVASWPLLALTPKSLVALVLGIVALDAAIQAVHVTSQSMIYSHRPDAGSRIIGGYMIFYSVGSAAGALAATTVYAAFGWLAVCLLGIGFSLTALGLWWRADTVNHADAAPPLDSPARPAPCS
ncbi:MFS transporter [Nocardia sp. NPDC058058]|uniref:MFS transporter n=1 Tax=Nocardia sp. NPDC058058 TaxID=3346317 RepID=UPI0036D75DF8